MNGRRLLKRAAALATLPVSPRSVARTADPVEELPLAGTFDPHPRQVVQASKIAAALAVAGRGHPNVGVNYAAFRKNMIHRDA
jgi:hypothetical protein